MSILRNFNYDQKTRHHLFGSILAIHYHCADDDRFEKITMLCKR